MESKIPAIGKMYKVISGVYEGFEGECVSYDLESDLPVVLTNKQNWKSVAVKLNEIEFQNAIGKTDISNLQKN